MLHKIKYLELRNFVLDCQKYGQFAKKSQGGKAPVWAVAPFIMQCTVEIQVKAAEVLGLNNNVSDLPKSS